MNPAKTQCTQAVDLQNQCSTLLNPTYFTDNLRVFAGTAGNSDRITVTVANLYDIDPVTKEYSVLDDDYVLETFTDIVGTEVRCSGVLREIAYTVLITNDVSSQTTGDISILKVVDIQVDVVV